MPKGQTSNQPSKDETIFREILNSLGENLLEKWYPLAVDKKYGGYFTDISFDFKLEPIQHKMVVTQGRHVWTTAKAAMLFDSTTYAEAAKHGYEFFRKKMWDQKNGGFFQMRGGDGEVCDYLGFFDEKRTYGCAFAVYGLAALYELTKDPKVLDLAKEGFAWIEEHAHDPNGRGYFQFMTAEGKPYGKNAPYKTKAYDEVEAGYKDQNSSIHLLEAYTELYGVWPDKTLKNRLNDLLLLIRDTITAPEGYMNLFFDNDWNPLSFKNTPKEIREKNYRLDHVSFGHNYETGFLMLEASNILGSKDDKKTLTVAKKMLDHALANGWDKENGGFVDEAYYFAGEKKCTVIKNTKNWWAQAEGLNVLLMMSKIFPNEATYHEHFLKQWSYIKNYLLDHKHGDWYEGGLDREPHFKNGPKGHIWKAAYHTGRALMNCAKMLAGDFPAKSPKNPGFAKAAKEMSEFIEHWRKIAEGLG
ncbi:MAG TPA: AGE family epimerase/isomerase [Candidatus Kryptonia bacterium]